MKGVLLFLLMIVGAVFVGLVIAYWYLRQFDDNGGRVRQAPRSIPFPEKHPPVNLTPPTPNLLEHQTDATGRPDGADIDGLMRRLAAVEAEQEHQPPQKPGASPDQERDDLKQISGIGPKLEAILNASGVFSFRQIAEWQDADIEAVDQLLPAFHGRIQREDWVGQARRLRDDKEAVDGTPSA